MATAKPDDLFVINRDDTTYSVRQDELMALIQPTDYMVINRNDITYKITGEEVIDSLVPKIIFTAVYINNTTPSTRDTLSATVDVSGGQPPYTLTYVWKYRNQTTGVPETVIDGASSSTLYIPDELAGYEFACEVTFTDSRGSSETKQSDYTEAAVLFAAPPILDNVDLTLNSSGTNRFTNETYSAKTTLTNDGQPSSNKIITAYCDGSFIQSTQSAPIEFIESVPANHTSRLSTNDPAGVFNPANLFNGDPGIYSYVGNAYWMQFIFPFPVPWNGNLDIYSSVSGGTIGTIMNRGEVNQLKATYTDDVVGPGYEFLTNWAVGAWGQAYADARLTQGARYETEITGIRYQEFNLPGTGNVPLSQFTSSENAKYCEVADVAKAVYLSDDIYYTITFQSDENLQYLEEGDEITETGGSAVGKVYKIDRVNRKIILTKPSDRTFTVGSRITIPAKPVVDNRLYLVLDSGGNVTDLDSNKPAVTYTSGEPNPEFLLKFPSVFPGGLTPDEELSANTRLTVEVTAANAVGTAGPVSDSITPSSAGFNLNDVFSTTLYTGNESFLTRTIPTGVNLNAGLAWIRQRSGGHPLVHRWHDSERSPSAPSRYIESNSDDPEGDASETVTDLFDGGFRMGTDKTLNTSNLPYVAWSFGKNRFFFDIVTYTGNNQTGRNINHNLKSKPGMILVKPLTGHFGNDNWIVYHQGSANRQGSAADNFAILNEAREFTPEGGTTWPGGTNTNVWQNTEPTSTVFTLGDSQFVNEVNRSYVAYLFASEAGGFGPTSTDQVIKCGSYTGNGSNQIIDMGFQPNFVMIKATTAPQPWYMADSVRGWDNVLVANSDGAENDEAVPNGSAVANGFSLFSGNGATNGAGVGYVYLAIA